MAGACSLRVLLVLVLAVASASLPPGIVVRLNKAALGYGLQLSARAVQGSFVLRSHWLICLFVLGGGHEAHTAHNASNLDGWLVPEAFLSYPAAPECRPCIKEHNLHVSVRHRESFLQWALQVAVPDFIDQSNEVLQSTRIQILDVHVPHLHLKFIADFGVHLSATANFTVKVFRVPEPLELVLPVVLMADVHVTRDSIGTPVLSISTCSSLFSPASMRGSSNSTSQELLVRVQEHIRANLNNKLCLCISGLVQDLNVHLGTLIGLTPVGPESQIRYFMISAPTITSNYMSLDVRAILFLLGKPILLPLHDADPFLLPWSSGVEGSMATVGLSQRLFDCALLMLQKAGSLNLEITGQLNSKSNPLNTSTLGQLIPEVAHQFPEPIPVVLKVQLGATPVATLHTGNATLRLQPSVEVLAATSNSALQSLFFLDVVVNLNLQLSVSKAKLRGTTSMLGGLQLSVVTSNVGSIDMDQVYTLMNTVFQKPLLTTSMLSWAWGLPSPSVLNLHYVHSEVSVCEGYVVISSGFAYQR